MKSPIRFLNRLKGLAACFLAAIATPVFAAPFTAGNVVIYRVGDGAGVLVNTGNAVFLDEYTPTGTLVQSVSLPTAVNGANKRLVASGTATSEGLLTRSTDGQYLVATGYDATPPNASSLTSSASLTVNRIIGRIDASGNIDTTTALTDAATGNNPRSAASVDGSAFWFTGGAGGMRYCAFGATTSTQVNTAGSPITNLRQAGIFGGQLFVTTGSGSAVRLGAVGTGTPSVAGQDIVNLVGIPTSGSPYAFLFADLDAGVAGVDTLYIADDGASALIKYSLVGGTWTSNGSVGVDADDYRGLTSVVSGGSVTLYGIQAGARLVSLVDSSGYNGAFSGTPTLLATAGTNTAFRGVAMAPIPSGPIPTIATTGTLAAVSTTYGASSASPTSFSVSGTNMAAGITVTPPVGFEVSTTSDFTANVGTNAAPITVGASGTISSTTIYVRLPATATVAGSPYSGNIACSSAGAASVNVATVSSTVTPVELTITGLTGEAKTYNGLLPGTVTGTAALSGVLPADTANVTLGGAATATFATASIGTAKPLTVTGYTISGSAAGNYTLTQPSALTADINQAPLTVTANPVTKPFGDTLTGGPGSAAFTSSGLVNSETIATVTITYGSGAGAADAVGSYPGSVTPSAATGGTFTASNYSINYVAGNLEVIAFAPAFTSASINILAPNTGAWNPSGVFLNGTDFVNLGLQGVGRIPANSIDPVTGESVGSISDMQISGWKKNLDGSYSGSFHFLPDRGYNSGVIYSNYAARINDFSFNFTPYTGTAPITAQNQVAMTFAGSRRFRYDHDGNAATAPIFTTGLLADGTASLFGTTVPVTVANTTQSDGTFANRLTVDAEGLILDVRPAKAGTGWVSDEYGPYIYHFNAAGQIDGQVQLPTALVPHREGTPYFFNSPANDSGRRENQGMEGIAQSPDGTRLFALLQSATLQDSASGNQNRFNTRVLVYDIHASDTPSDPIRQYVIQLPRIDTDGNGSVDRTGAQSSILALNNHQLLILSRDGNGRGASGAPVFKSILLAELLLGATDIDGTFDAEAAAVAPAAVLNASVTPLTWTEALNMLGKLGSSTLELAKFNLNINGPPNDDINSLSEKWEALSMVSANDPANPNDYFLFIGNDNDFASQTGVYKDAAGALQSYNAGLENDSLVLAYRVRMTGADNQVPFVANNLTDQSATKGSGFTYIFPGNTFVDPEGETLTYTATRADGSPLPSWLTFNGGTRSFTGTPTAVDLGNLEVKVTATDPGIPALFVSTTFTISVAPAFGSPYFPQSVASGDPRDTSVILWTRLEDGDTGTDRTVTLHLTTAGSLPVVGTTGALAGTNLWTGGNLSADADHDGVVKVQAGGLNPDTTYYYQFTYDGNRSPIGRTRTAPAAGTTRTVKYAAINCNDFVGRYFNSLKHLCDQEAGNIDFVLNLGDYIYETTGDPSFQTSLPERAMVLSNPAEAIDLGGGNFAAQSIGNYRDIYKTIRQDRQLQRVHELFPMISIWDDHEFSDDNWQDNATYFDGKVAEQQTQRKRNGEQAWMEFLPTSRGLAGSGNGLEIDAADLYPNTTIYDSFNFGGVLDLITTDIRTQRVDHLIPEDAFPATVPMDETATIATLAAAYGLDVPTFTGAVWPGIKASFAPYIDINDGAYADVKALLQAIVGSGVNASLAALPAGQTAATTGAAYAAAKVTGNLDASFVNSTFAAAGQPAPFDATALNAMPRGLSFFLLGKTGFFGDYGSRYQVVDQTFQLYAGYMYQLFVGSGGALGRDQAFYNSTQQTFLGTALATSAGAGNTWRVVASSTPFTPIKLELGDLPPGVTLPTQGTISGVTIPASIPSQFLVEFLLNADEPAGFPQYRQGIIDLLAQHDAIIVSGDIHAQLIGNNLATNGQKVVDFTVPSASSSQFRRAVDGAFSIVESLMTPSVQAATSLPGNFTFDAAQKQAVIDATDEIIKRNTPEMFDADTATHGYTVFTASPTGFFANYRKIDVSKIDENLYGQTPAALDTLFNRQDLTVSKTGSGAGTDLTLGATPLSPPSLVTGPSTTGAPYLTSHLPGVELISLLTTGDGQTVPKLGGGTTRLAGISDGLGAYDNGDGTFTILVNHEITSNRGAARDHGSVGAFVSKWIVDKATFAVTQGDDLIKEVYLWNGTAFSGPTTTAFDRLCSADLPVASALYNAATNLGSQQQIFLNGEEASDGRAWAHVVTGPDAGKSYQLAHFGYTNFENVLLCPAQQNKTIAIMTNDAPNGEVFVYVGTKTNSGTEPEKAGLVGGTLYGMAVPGKPFELALNSSLAVGPSESFTLATLGTPGDYPVNASDTNNRATTQGVLQMGGPEDGAWDTRPGFENTFYFVTKGTSSNGIEAPTRVWKMVFADIAQPQNGGTLSLLLDGPANRLGSLDNVTFDNGKLFIQEDLGDEQRLSKIWQYDVTTGTLQEVAEHRGNSFYPGGANFLTTNEESSGIIPLSGILGNGWYAASVQVHTNSHIPSGDRTELVEGGQLCLLYLGDREADLVRAPIIQSGATWRYLVGATDPGATWKDAGFNDASWGSGPSMLGYGDDIETLTDITQPAAPRPAATYFRSTFNVSNPADAFFLDLYLKYDDGAVVYINGVEVARANMSRTAAVTNATFASTTVAGEADWKRIMVPCENVNLQATGNVIAVSVHQDAATSSDTRLDVELFAWKKSPDSGSAPGTPSGLAVGNPTNNTLDLTWAAQSDSKSFIIERQQTGELTWQVIADDVPGNFSSYDDFGLSQGSTYSYRIWALNQHGASVCTAPVSGTTTNIIIPTLFFEDFASTTNTTASGTFSTEAGVRIQSVASNRSWYVGGPFGTLGKVANGNGFGGDVGSDDWLFLPPLNMSFFSNETFSFVSDARFDDLNLASVATTVPTGNTGLDVLISTNYNPAVHTDPRTATWTLLNPSAAFDTDFAAFGSGVASGGIDLSAINGIATIAFRYRSTGTTSNNARHWEITDLQVLGSDTVNFETATGLTPFNQVSLASDKGWSIETTGGRAAATADNTGAAGGTGANDWLISPAFAAGFDDLGVTFDYYESGDDTGSIPQGKPLAVLLSTNYNPAVHTDPSTATWTDITPSNLDGSSPSAWRVVNKVPLGLAVNTWGAYVAFRYQSSGAAANSAQLVAVDNVKFERGAGPLTADFVFTQKGTQATFDETITGGVEPYTLSWNFGNGSTATGSAPGHTFANNGSFSVTLTVTDAASTQAQVSKTVTTNFTQFAIPAKVGDIRVATFNTAMNSDDINGSAGDANAVANALASGTHPSIKKVAEVIQRLNPDMVLLNEIDLAYSGQNFDAVGTLARVDDLRTKYLGVAQAPDTSAVTYPYHYIGGTNTGLAAGYDLRNNGSVDTSPGDQTYGDDSFGFGQFPGKYGFVVLSKYPIDTANVRTFQKFLWKDMPGALLPEDPADTDGNSSTASFYSPAELNVFRLSSKSHWDVPVTIGTETVHLLCSHPTPPVFDDGETLTHNVATGTAATKADWNGLRNNDEIRFWADYVDPAKDNYIYDDSEISVTGTDGVGNQLYTGVPTKQGLGANQRFVILGDLNSDPVDGDSSFAGVTALTTSAFVDTTVTPQSTGATEQVPGSFNNRATKTSSFNLRADYALPSQIGTTIAQSGVVWPLLGDATVYLLDASDHRSVWVDLSLSATQVAVNPTVTGSIGGTVTGGGAFAPGAAVTLTAAPATGYKFAGWKVDGAPAGSNPVLQVNATDGQSIEATFVYPVQILHYYGESGLLGVQTAPVMGALIDKFDGDYANTVVLAEGDSFIPGPWLVAGADPSFNALLHTTAQVNTGTAGALGVAGSFNATATATTAVPFGRADIAIMNAFGTTASALGNHEFDLGSPVLASAFYPATTTGSSAVGNWIGAQFPFITTNLDFANDSSLRGRADLSLGGVSGTGNNAPNVNAINAGTIANLEVNSVNLRAKIAPYAIKTINGEKIGFVGATTWELLSKSSPNGTVPKDDGNAGTTDLQEVAAYLQGAVNALQALGVNKIIQLDQLDTLDRNKDLAGLVSGIDIVVAGGGHEYMKDANDTLGTNAGHTSPAADAYPIQTTGLDGKPVLIVTTDTEYSYLGRLVVDFDNNGELVISSLDNVINGAYPAEATVLESVYGSGTAATIIAGSPIASGVKAITDGINTVISTKEGNVFGYTNVYLEGDRVFGRTQEVNLGNITADANAAKARTALGLAETGAVFSLKNGGGIRASIGAIDANGTKVAPVAIPGVKAANAISQLDIENALRFDNKLMVFDATPQELLNILNFAAGLSSGPSQQNGGYPQIGGLRFSYNYSLPVGQRVRSIALYNEAGAVVAPIVADGAVLSGAPTTIQCVILNFTANGGDSYPIKANGQNFRYLLAAGGVSAPVSEALDFTAEATMQTVGQSLATVMGEQKAFQDFLLARHPAVGNAYNVADTVAANDLRIQILPGATDTVLPSVTINPTIAGSTGGTVNGAGTFTTGATATFTATPASGFTFRGWTVNGTPSAETSTTLNVTVAAGLTVEASFSYQVQILHYYGESGLLGVQTAPVMGALIDKFDGDYANTVVLAEGDSFIPGPWLVAGADPSFNALLHTTAQVNTGTAGALGVAGSFNATATATTAVPFGRADIAIMNAFGTTASALGNHEFDLGSPVLASAFYPATTTGSSAVGNWIGAQFPFITTNLDFANDSSLRGRADLSLGGVSGTGNNAPNVNAINAGTIANLEVNSVNLRAKIAPYAIKTINGEKIGFVGATTWELLSKSSPNGTVPKDDGNAGTTDLQEVAAYLQGAVNALQALGVNKIIQLDQLDTLDRNKDLAGLVSGIDIVVAGGGHEYMKDANDVLGSNAGHTTPAADAYPIQTTGLDGKPVLIVTTDTEYSYLGRLVVDFDNNGELIISSLDSVINGAYPAEATVLESVYGSGTAATIIAGSPMASGVKAITDAINTVVSTKEGNVFGYTNVYLEGDRVFGRTQEVNLGDITADANAAKARTALGVAETGAVFSLKNGGGIRASVGAVNGSGVKVAPVAIPGVKSAGAISQLDIENALRFDNKLMVFETNPQGLLNILNFAAGLSSGSGQQNGGYPQIGNLRFSYNYSLAAGQRVRSVALYNEAGQVVAPIVSNGIILPGAPATIRCVTLNFMAQGGDSYPIKANGSNFRYLLTDGTLSPAISEALDFTAAANVPANALGEQKAFQDFLLARHPVATPYNVADTAVANDPRIKILPTATDNIIPADQDTDDNGLTDVIEGQLAALIANPFYVGQTLTTELDLGAILHTLFPPATHQFTVSGLPTGLGYNITTGRIEGTISAENGDAAGLLTIRQGRTTVATLPFSLKVQPFQFTGSYEMLIQTAAEVPVGKAKLTVTGPKAYSATLELQGQKVRSIKASLSVNLTTPLTVSFPAAGTILKTDLDIILSPTSDLISGNVTGALDGTTLRGFRLVNPGRGASQRVTLALQGPTGDPEQIPGGTGHATGTATVSGTLPLKGQLGDAQAFTTSLNLSVTNQAVVFVQPYADKTGSFFGGIVTVGDIGLPVRGASTESQAVGLKWRKLADASLAATVVRTMPKSYTAGLGVATPLAVTGSFSKWVSLPSAEALSLSLGLNLRQIEVSYTAAPVGPVLPSLLAVRNGSLRAGFPLVRITPANAVGWSARAFGTDGRFTGNLTLPTPAAKSAVSGVFLQDESFDPIVGLGLIRVPQVTPAGTYRTTGIRFEN